MVDEEKGEAEKIEKPSIDDRIKELEDMDLDKGEIVLKLYEEGYGTQEIMKHHLPLKVLKREKERAETGVLGAVEGAVKGSGYLEELKNMVRSQIGRTRELTEEFYNLGLGVLLASLRKSGLSIEDFQKIALHEEPLKAALKQAGLTAFKALEYYQSNLITKVEDERDQARAYASILDARIEEVKRKLDRKFRLEKMIYNLVLLSGSMKVDPEALTSLVDKWLGLEVIAA